MGRSTPGTDMDFAADATWWQTIANEFTVKTRQMWQDGWFRDYDAVTREWSAQQDAMHLAPVFVVWLPEDRSNNCILSWHSLPSIVQAGLPSPGRQQQQEWEGKGEKKEQFIFNLSLAYQILGKPDPASSIHHDAHTYTMQRGTGQMDAMPT